MLQTLLSKIRIQGEVSKRIKRRHQAFWSQPGSEYIRNAVMNSGDPIDKWTDVPNWQRRLSNKYNAREFAKMHECPVAGLYWKGRDPDLIDFDKLPDQYVIRPTIGHSCNKVFLMNKRLNLLDKQQYTRAGIRAVVRDALAENPTQEFLVEEFLRSEDGEYKIPDDFKIHTFNGEVAFIAVVNRLGRREGSHSFYDPSWKVLKKIHTGYPMAPYQPPPACLDEMLYYARKLSKIYRIFVRIDFYATDKGAVFGEFTPTPSLGDGYSNYGEKMLLYYWNKYCYGMI